MQVVECEIDIRTLTSHQVFGIRKDGRGWVGFLALEKTAGGGRKYSFTGLLGRKIQCTALLGWKIQCTVLLGQKNVTR